MWRFLKAIFAAIFGKKKTASACQWATVTTLIGCQGEEPKVTIGSVETINCAMPTFNFNASFSETGSYVVELVASIGGIISNTQTSITSGTGSSSGTFLSVQSAGPMGLAVSVNNLLAGDYKIRITKPNCGFYESGLFFFDPNACGGIVSYTVANNVATITNGDLRLEVDFNFGGTIRHLSQQSKGIPNVINIRDAGRYTGISAYSGPENYQVSGGIASTNPAYATMSWNAVQAGDDGGNGSPVIFDGTSPSWNPTTRTLYVKANPLQWKFVNRVIDTEVLCESWYTFDAVSNSIRVRYKMTVNRSDQTVYLNYPVELPYLFFTRQYENIIGYNGSQPYTNLPTETFPYTFNYGPNQSPPFEAGQILPTESWLAMLDNSGKGVGVYVKNQWLPFRYQRISDMSEVLPTSFSTMVLQMIYSPSQTNCCPVYECEFEIALGTANEIRALAYSRQ